VEGAAQQPAREKPAPGTLEDEILLHELVHAMEFLTGKSVSRAVPFQPLYDTREELFAIVVTNIYRSEWPGRSQIRAHHHGFVASEMDSRQFLRAGMNRHHMRQLRRRYPVLFSDLHALDMPFNPIRLMDDV
jgi:hypothetical protein